MKKYSIVGVYPEGATSPVSWSVYSVSSKGRRELVFGDIRSESLAYAMAGLDAGSIRARDLSDYHEKRRKAGVS